MWRWVWIGLLLVGALNAQELVRTPVFRFDGEMLTVHTPTLDAAIWYGAVCGLTSHGVQRLTVPVPELAEKLPYLVHGIAVWPEGDAKAIAGLGETHSWQGMYALDRRHAWLRQPGPKSFGHFEPEGERAGRLIYTGLHGWEPDRFYPRDRYELRIRVLDDGSLALDANGEIAEGTAFGIATAVVGLRQGMRYTLPLFEGMSFLGSEVPSFQMVAHWPQPWQAGLAIAEFETGSLGLWTADAEMKDRYFHVRHDTDGSYTFAIESINDGPFKGRTAVSRPMRLGVYKGDWRVPAGAFRDWWATTFQVKPMAERRPAWAADIRAILAHHTEAIPEVMKGRALIFGAQDWRVQPEVGDRGLFPFDMASGPELKVFKRVLPRARENRLYPYVYQNISHMCRAHPLAPQFWEHRVVPVFAPAQIEEDPKFGSSSSFVVNCAWRPWQDLVIDWLKQVDERFGIKGYYLDCARGMPNSALGLIDGKNDCQGEVELVRRLREAVPEAFIGSEYLTEVTATVVDAGAIGYDSWFGDAVGFPREGAWRNAHAHPLYSFLWSRYSYIYSYGQQLSSTHETLGRLSSAWYPDLGEGAVTDYCKTEDFYQMWARLCCRTGMIPDFSTPEPWQYGWKSMFRDAAGNRYRLADMGGKVTEGRLLKTAPDGTYSVMYARCNGRTGTQVSPGCGIPGWVGYAENQRSLYAIGLDPAREYLEVPTEAYPEAAPPTDWRISQLPRGACIESCRPYRDGFMVVELGTTDGKPHEGRMVVESKTPLAGVLAGDLWTAVDGAAHRHELSVTAPCTVVAVGVPFSRIPGPLAEPFDFTTIEPGGFTNLDPGTGVRTPVRANRRTHVTHGQVPALRMMPNHREAGVADYLLELPEVSAGKRLVLSMTSTVPEFKNNGYRLLIKGNGRVLLDEERKGGSGEKEHGVDLTALAGKRVLFTVEVQNHMLFKWVDFLSPTVVVRQ